MSLNSALRHAQILENALDAMSGQETSVDVSVAELNEIVFEFRKLSEREHRTWAVLSALETHIQSLRD